MLTITLRTRSICTQRHYAGNPILCTQLNSLTCYIATQKTGRRHLPCPGHAYDHVHGRHRVSIRPPTCMHPHAACSLRPMWPGIRPPPLPAPLPTCRMLPGISMHGQDYTSCSRHLPPCFCATIINPRMLYLAAAFLDTQPACRRHGAATSPGLPPATAKRMRGATRAATELLHRAWLTWFLFSWLSTCAAIQTMPSGPLRARICDE